MNQKPFVPTNSSIRLVALGCSLVLGMGGCHPCFLRYPDDCADPCRTCGAVRGGGRARPVAPEMGYHNHPRFHPVPAQPVFTPRPFPIAGMYGVPAGDLQPVPATEALPSSRPSMEEILTPPGDPPDPPHTEPQPLSPIQSQRTNGWIFSPSPPPGKPERSVVVQADIDQAKRVRH